MTHYIKSAILALGGLSLIAGASLPLTAEARTTYRCEYQKDKSSKEGTVVGAVAGGLIGGSLADTHNKGLGTVVGAVAGGVVGNKVGRNQGKRRCQDEVAYRTKTVYEKDKYGKKHKVVYRYVRQ
ncbi:MAG: glycine zipper 2TM domain-containing protein [Asticcacaulis sp.]